MSSLAKQRSDSQKLLGALFAEPKRVLLIHYSCEDFSNRPDGTSARVTSIAVRHLDSGQTHSFSIHLSAERLKIPYADIRGSYELLEKDLLTEFCTFMNKHLSFTWVHWNMRDSNYGFAAIYHRCRLHGIEPSEIESTSLVDLSRCLVAIYGRSYIEHPRLPKLLELNAITTHGYIDGATEAKTFAEGDYVALHRSTLRKVDSFESIIARAHAGSLKTHYRWRDIYGRSVKDVVFFLKEHWIYTAFGMLSLIVTLFSRVIYLFFRGG